MVEIDCYSSDRKFQLWSYTISMGLLLFRSTKSPEHTIQVDVLFRVADHVRSHNRIEQFGFRVPSAHEVARFQSEAAVPLGRSTLYRLLGSSTGWVLATSARMLESDAEYYEPSPLLENYSL